MRCVWAVGLALVLVSGCIGTDDAPAAPDTTKTAERDEALASLVQRYPHTEGAVLYGIHAIEALDLDARETDRRRAPIGGLLGSEDDPDRLDGEAAHWLFLFRTPDGGFAHATQHNGRFSGWGWMSPFSTHPHYEHVDGGAALGPARIGAVEAAQAARETGRLDAYLDDPRFDLYTTLQHWPGSTNAVWVFEAQARDGPERAAIAIEAVTGAAIPAAERPMKLDESLESALIPPGTVRSIYIEIPALGYDRVAWDVQTEMPHPRWILIDPTGNSTDWPAGRDPLAGIWRVDFESTLPLQGPVSVQVCLDEHPPVREGMQPSPCDSSG